MVLRLTNVIVDEDAIPIHLFKSVDATVRSANIHN